MKRNNMISWFVGLYAGKETVKNVQFFKSMAKGWRFVNVFVLGYIYKQMMMNQTASMYGPVMGAYFRKYADCVQKDPNAIVDEKKSYFYIDTSEYMSYSNADLSDEYHVHHGPQPEGDSLDSSWLSEVDKFLKGEENQLKQHHKFYDYNFEFIDKSFPSAEKVSELMHKTE